MGGDYIDWEVVILDWDVIILLIGSYHHHHQIKLERNGIISMLLNVNAGMDIYLYERQNKCNVWMTASGTVWYKEESK